MTSTVTETTITTITSLSYDTLSTTFGLIARDQCALGEQVDSGSFTLTITEPAVCTALSSGLE